MLNSEFLVKLILKKSGPGTYENKSTVVNRPSYIFGKDTNRNFYDVGKVPGPGTYKSGGQKVDGPKWGFAEDKR